MATLDLTCPGCQGPIRVPMESVGKRARCLHCGVTFPIVMPTKYDPIEDAVADWLDSPEARAQSQRAAASSAAAGLTAAVKPAVAPPVLRPPRAVARASRTFAIRLDHVDSMGAFFRFAPQLLYDQLFRASFPQQCIICGSPEHLTVHCVVWSSKLANRRLTAPPTKWVKRLSQLGRSSGTELLDKLPKMENLPEPYNLPMPYYICDSCSPVGAVMAVVHPSRDGAGEDCVLGVASLPQAEAFLAATRGMDCDDLQQIRAHRTEHADPWTMLPLTVRIRIGQWYKPQMNERFMAYMPDLEFSKAEAGLAGLVVTDHRLVYHKGLSSLDMNYSEPITLHFKPLAEGGRTLLQVNCGAKHAMLLTQESCIQQLRQVLHQHRGH